MTKHHGNRVVLLIALAVITLLVLAASIRYGAIDFSIGEISRALASMFPGHPAPTLDQRIFLELRLPRAIMCLLVGASLGVGGTLMQALFRNPIVEPGLVGTSSGAAFPLCFSCLAECCTLARVCGVCRSRPASAAWFRRTWCFCWRARAKTVARRS